MNVVNVYRKLAGCYQKSASFLCIKNTKMQSKSRNSNYINSKVPHFKQTEALSEALLCELCVFFSLSSSLAAFAALRETLPNSREISRKAAKNAKERKKRIPVVRRPKIHILLRYIC